MIIASLFVTAGFANAAVVFTDGFNGGDNAQADPFTSSTGTWTVVESAAAGFASRKITGLSPTEGTGYSFAST